MSHYLIFSKRHTQGIAMWWRANAAGYTNNLDEAGRYTKEEAESYCAASHGDDVPVRELGAYSLAQRRIVDMGDGANQALLMMPNLKTTETEMHTNAPEGISRNHLIELAKKTGLVGGYRTAELLDAVEGYARVVLSDKAVQEAFVAANQHLLKVGDGRTA